MLPFCEIIMAVQIDEFITMEFESLTAGRRGIFVIKEKGTAYSDVIIPLTLFHSLNPIPSPLSTAAFTVWMKMGKDHLYITVPTFFRCPISLDVMKSPVTLCTGVTYDRSSIQRWLDGGNNTCPATMQILHSKDLVPNRTLQRLIEFWSASVRREYTTNAPAPKLSLSREDVLLLAESIGDSSMQDCLDDTLTKIERFGRESAENCEFLYKIDGLAGKLIGLLRNAGGFDGAIRRLDSLEHIVKVSEMVLTKTENRENLMVSAMKQNLNCLDSILDVIQRGSVDSKIASLKLIEFFAFNAESKLSIAGKDGLLLQLLNMLSPEETDASLVDATLSCLISLSKPRRVKVKLANLQSVKKLSNLLAAASPPSSATEKALHILAAVSSCSEGRKALCRDSTCVELVLQRAFKVSSAATEMAIAILWSACCVFREEEAREVLLRCNGLARALVLMQSNCSPAVKQMATDLVKVLGLNSKCRLSSYETNTTHIMPF